MMKSMNRIQNTLLAFACCACAVLQLCGCTEAVVAEGKDVGAVFRLKGEERAMAPASRAVGFEAGTRYALWAVSDGNWTNPVLKIPSILSDESGRLEKTNPNTFCGVMDFYSLTWGTEEALSTQDISENAGGEPLFSHQRGADCTLPDLCRAENRGCTAANTGGEVVLPFKHTLVKLNYEVVRHSDESLDGAKITSIRVFDHESGVLNVATGTYDYGHSGKEWYEVPLSAAVDVDVTTNPVLTEDGNLVETLVFPNDAENDDWLTVAVTVRKKDGTEYTTEYRIPMGVDEGETAMERPFPFVSNYKYTLQLTVMTDNGARSGLRAAGVRLEMKITCCT